MMMMMTMVGVSGPLGWVVVAHHGEEVREKEKVVVVGVGVGEESGAGDGTGLLRHRVSIRRKLRDGRSQSIEY